MNHKRKIIMIVFFCLGIGIAAGANSFRQGNNEEGGHFTFQTQEEEKQVVTIDLAKQGTLKYYLQPGTITLYGRGKSTLPDAGVYTKFYGVKGFVSQGSKKSSWTELKEDMQFKSKRNGVVSINVEVEIPYSNTKKYEVGRAALEFWHDNQRVKFINFQFVNSHYSQ